MNKMNKKRDAKQNLRSLDEKQLVNVSGGDLGWCYRKPSRYPDDYTP